jgi:hypothetical protein
MGGERYSSYDDIPDEKKARMVRWIADLTMALISQQEGLTMGEAISLVEGAKRMILKLYPDKESTYELIYAPRFRRAIESRFGREI